MPLTPIFPAIGIQCNFILAAGLDAVSWAYYIGFLAVGLLIYFTYSIRHSVLEPQNLQGRQEQNEILKQLVSTKNKSHTVLTEKQE